MRTPEGGVSGLRLPPAQPCPAVCHRLRLLDDDLQRAGSRQKMDPSFRWLEAA